MSKHSIDNEYYSTLELVVNDQDANAPELLTNASHKDTPNARPDLFLSTSAPEVLVPPEKEVCISPSQPGREKQSKQKLRILALVVVLLIVLGVGIGTGVGVGMNNHKSSNQTFTSTATAAFGATPTSSTTTTVPRTTSILDTTESSRDSSTKSSSFPSFSSIAASSTVRLVTITFSPSSTTSSVSPTTCTWLGHCLGAACETFNDCSGTMICSKDKKCAPLGSEE